MLKLLNEIDRDFLTHLQFLKELVAFPTVSSQPHCGETMAAASQWLQTGFDEAGLTTLIRRPVEGHPAVVAYTQRRENVPHILLYGHYDVSAPDAEESFRPVICGDVLKGVGAGGHKGLLAAYLCALRGLHLTGGYLPVNLTVLVEGEKTIGSPNLQQHLEFLASECAPFDIAILAADSGPELKKSDPKLPPAPYKVDLSESERVMLEVAESALGSPEQMKRVSEPFHTFLATRGLLLCPNSDSNELSLERYRNWIRTAVVTLHRMAERFQAFHSSRVEARIK